MNLLGNSDFEQGRSDHWVAWAVSGAVTNTAVHYGSYAACVSLPPSASRGALIQEVSSGWTTGAQLYASAWIRTDNLNVDAFLRIEFMQGGTLIGFLESKKFTGSNVWMKANASGAVPTNTTLVKVLLELDNPTGTGSSGGAYFDDVCLSATIPDAAWSWPMGQTLSTVGHTWVGYAMIDDGIWNGVPIGGFGAGSIGRTFNGDFSRWHLDVGTHRCITVPANQFHVFMRAGNVSTSQVLWAWHPDGYPASGPLRSWNFDYPAKAGTYYALFPRAWWDYSANSNFPVNLVCEQFSPIIAGNYKETSYPVGVYKWTARNTSSMSATVSVMFTWENMTGWAPDDYSRWEQPVTDPLWGASEHNFNYARTDGDIKGVVMASTKPVTSELDGQFCIAAKEVPGVTVSYKGTFDCNGDGSDLWNEFSDDGVLNNTDARTVAGENDDYGAAVAVTFNLAPGQMIEFPMVLSWDQPFVDFGGHRLGEAFPSSIEGSGEDAWLAIDGQMNSRWASAKTSNEWIYVDYMTPRQFNQVVLFWEAAYGKQYQVQVANDLSAWTTIYTETNGSGGINVINTGEQQARYLKIQCLERGLPTQGYSLWEIEQSIRPVAAVASSGSGDAGAASAADGNYGTSWVSDANDDEWIYIDLGQSRPFNFINLYWQADYGKAYEIQISSNATDWFTVARENNGDGDKDVVYTGDQTAQYVRMKGLQRATTNGYALSEFSVSQAAGPRQWYKYYTQFFGKGGTSSWEIAKTALNNYQDWEQEIEAWQRPYIEDPYKPNWYRCALMNELYFLVDGGTFWEDGLKGGAPEPVSYPDNKFGLMECFDFGNYSAFDVETYGSFSLITLWPELEKQILRQSVDVMDGTSSARPCGDGSPLNGNVMHDMSDSMPYNMYPDRDPFFRFNVWWGNDTTKWKDMNAKFMLRMYRDYIMTGDPEFVCPKNWSAAKIAMQRLRDRGDAESLPVNQGTDETYDTWSMYGTSAYCGGLWLAALKAGIEVAKIRNDPDTQQLYAQWFGTAYPAFESRLWNGQYFEYDTDSRSANGHADNHDTIMADQMCGEWFARASGLTVLPSNQVATALQTIYNNNVRGAGLNGMRGAVNGIKPDGTINTSAEQSQEAWSGVTYGLAALMIHNGLTDLAEATAWGVYHTVYEEKGYWFRTPEAWNANGDYRATLYNRPMAIWGMQHAYDLQRSRPVATASSEGTGMEASKASDGDPATRWSSDASDDQWITLDFLRPRTFDRVKLTWETAYGDQYQIQVSNDGVQWTTVYTETNGNGGVDIIDVGQQNARYVRMNGVHRATIWGYSLWEFAAYRADDDGDGIPDAWELQHAANLGVMSSNTDSDGEGYLDWQECVAGTDPNDPASFLAVVSRPLSEDECELDWSSVSGHYYNLYRSIGTQDSYLLLKQDVPATTPMNSCTDRVTDVDRAYYKVQVEE